MRQEAAGQMDAMLGDQADENASDGQGQRGPKGDNE